MSEQVECIVYGLGAFVAGFVPSAYFFATVRAMKAAVRMTED